MKSARVAFIGAGQMGAPMVHRLLQAGRDTTVFARRDDIRDELSRAGATVTSDLGDATRNADVVLLCLYSDAQVREVALGAGNLFAAMQPNSLLVVHTTGSPATARALGEAGRAGGVSVVDAPVSGSPAQISEGRLTVMLGGHADDVTRAGEVIAAYADPIFTIGELGSAQVVKLVNNALFAANIQLAAEAERIANELEVATEVLATTIQRSSGASFVMGLVAAMGSIEPLVASAGHFMRKDVDVVKEVAADLGVDLGILGEVCDGGPIRFIGRG